MHDILASATEMVKRGCIERSGRLSTDVFPDYSAVFELNTDLDNFVREIPCGSFTKLIIDILCT